jgi:ribonuclease H / adenosylcobalamin/alpha-ribazole phosphatase
MHVVIHTDGGCRPNPGPAGYGVVIHGSDGRWLGEQCRSIGHATSNIAEYAGLES